MSDVEVREIAFDEAFCAFADALIAWIKEGGDKRLDEFTPFDAWAKAVATKALLADAQVKRLDKLPAQGHKLQ